MPTSIDYARVLTEMGYAPLVVPRVVQLIESQRRDGSYAGFRAALAIANIAFSTSPGFRAPQVEPVVRRIEALEAPGRAMRLIDEVQERRRLEERDAAEVSRAQTGLLLSLTDEELNGRVRLDPEVAEEWRDLFPDKPIINGRVSTEAQRQRLRDVEDRVEVERLRKELGLAPVEESVDWGRVSAALAKNRQDTLDALAAIGTRPARQDEQSTAAAETRLDRATSGHLSADGWWIPGDAAGDVDRKVSEQPAEESDPLREEPESPDLELTEETDHKAPMSLQIHEHQGFIIV